MRVEYIGDATLYLGDSMEILDSIGHVDCVVTDPPYGIGVQYDSIDDSLEYIREICVPIINKCIKIADVVSLTPGVNNIAEYPKPKWILCWLVRAGAGRSPWGFSCWQPILVYGKDPYLAKRLGARPDFIDHTESSEKNGHPCPKPIKLMEKWITRVNLGGTILDPFMGSGTTGVACVNLGRKFIGIEISEKYFDIACKRIETAYSQPRLFDDLEDDKNKPVEQWLGFEEVL